MAATTISRATWTDGVSGTVLANARLQADIYDKIDSLIGASITFGGTISTEGFGTHTWSAGSSGRNELIVRNSSAGTTNLGRLQAQADGASPAFISIDMASSTFTTSGGLVASGGRVFCGGTAGLAIETNATSGTRFYSNNTLRGTVGDTNGILLENTYGFKIKNTGGNAIDGVVLTSGNQMNIGSDSAANVVDTQISAGAAIRFRTNSAERVAINSSGQLLIGDGSVSVPAFALSSDTDTGFYWDSSNGVNLTLTSGGSKHTAFLHQNAGGGKGVFISGVAAGTGAVAGSHLIIGANSSGNGAAAYIAIAQKSGAPSYLWADASGNLRISSFPPLEDGSVSDTSGTVVGLQVSSRDSKQHIQPFADREAALRLVRETPLYTFSYKQGCGLQGERFTGIITDESPVFGMDRDDEHPGGKCLNTVTAVGYLMACVQVLADRVEALELNGAH